MADIINTVNFTKQITKNSTVEDLRLILNECEIKNRGLLENADSLYQKALVILGISITGATAVIGYLSIAKPAFTALNIIAIEVLVLLAVSSIYIAKVIFMARYQGNGAHPIKLVQEDFYKKLKGKTPEWYILQRLISDYQSRLDVNVSNESKRSNNIKQGLRWLFAIPITSAITLLIFLVINSLKCV